MTYEKRLANDWRQKAGRQRRKTKLPWTLSCSKRKHFTTLSVV